MVVLNILIALVVAVTVWYFMARGLAKFIFAAETRDPEIAKRAIWGVFEMAATFTLFLISVGLVVGLTMLLEQLNR